MKARTMFMFMIALVLGVTAAIMANNWIEKRLQPTADNSGTPVVVAALDIPFGTRIEPAHIKVVEWPSGEAPKGSMSDPKMIVGKISKQSLLPGEVILEERIVEHLGGSTLASIVEQNKRAVTVRVNDVIGVAGFLLPGNRVDVLFTKSQGKNQSVTQTILQDIKVLAVDQTASTDKDRPVVVRAVTIELTPAEAEVLVKATSEGSLQLTLRNPLDSELVARKEKPEKKVVAKNTWSGYGKEKVTIIRGTDVSTTSLTREPRIIKK
jgi:pilus assembly protein CpaB